MTDDIPIAKRQSLLAGESRYASPRLRQVWIWAGLGVGILVVSLLGLSVSWRSGAGSRLTTATPIMTAAPLSTPIAVLPATQTAAAGTPLEVLGHHAFSEAPLTELIGVGTYHGREVKLRRPAAQQFSKMVEAARQAGVALIPISGFRSIADQDYLFFRRAQAQALRPEERALVSAPPGYSEHHTGYAVDIGDGLDPSRDTQLSFESSPAFRWLQTHAAQFGYELSFPPQNAQGISYEPWHWRFVGDRNSLETFYANRSPQP